MHRDQPLPQQSLGGCRAVLVTLAGGSSRTDVLRARTPRGSLKLTASAPEAPGWGDRLRPPPPPQAEPSCARRRLRSPGLAPGLPRTEERGKGPSSGIPQSGAADRGHGPCGRQRAERGAAPEKGAGDSGDGGTRPLP